MYFGQIQAFSQLSKPRLHAPDHQPVVRGFQRDEQCRVRICALVEVVLQMYFGSCIEVHKALLVTFTDHNAFPLVEVNVFSVQHDHLSNTHPRGSE